MKTLIIGMVALAMVMVGSIASAEANGWDESTYAEGLQAQGALTGLAIEDVSFNDTYSSSYTSTDYRDYTSENASESSTSFALGGFSIDTIGAQITMIETGAGHSGNCASDLDLNQTLSIKTDSSVVKMTQSAVGSSTRTCGRMER